MDLPDVLIDHPDGEIRVRGSRIGMHHILYLHRRGRSAEFIAREFDSISLAAIRETIAFCEANRPEVDAYIEAHEAECNRIRELYPRRTGPTREELEARWRAKRQGESK